MQANGRLQRWDSKGLRPESLVEAPARDFDGFRGCKGLKAGKRQVWTPRRSDGCGLGVAFACAVGRSAKLLQSFKGFRGFKRFKRFKGFRGFKGLRAGKRQAWTPIRSHGCGLGVAFACAGKRSEKLLQSLWPWGSFCLRGWALRKAFAKF